MSADLEAVVTDQAETPFLEPQWRPAVSGADVADEFVVVDFMHHPRNSNR